MEGEMLNILQAEKTSYFFFSNFKHNEVEYLTNEFTQVIFWPLFVLSQSNLFKVFF